MGEKKVFGVSCGCMLFILILNVLLGGFCTEYVVEYWGTLIKGAPVDVPFLPCAVAGLFLGEITIPAAALTWVFSFVL